MTSSNISQHTPESNQHSNQKNEQDNEKNQYDFTNLSFEELFRVPVAEMVFQGEPLAGPDFFELDFLALQKIPFYLPEDKDKANLTASGHTEEVTDDSFDFLSLSFEELLRVPVKVNIWQQGDTVPEPDIDTLSLEDLMKLPVRRAFLTELDPNVLNKLLGDDSEQLFSSTDSNENNNSGRSGYNTFFEPTSYGNTSTLTSLSQPTEQTNNNNQNNSGGGITPLPPPIPPQAINDNTATPTSTPGQYFAIKSFGQPEFSENSGNLINNDIPGSGQNIRMYDVTFVNNNGQTQTLSFDNTSTQVFTPRILGSITLNQNGAFSYTPPSANNANPTIPQDYSFSYRVIDSNNIPSNYATVNLKLYDPPVLHINDVQIIEGAINPIALFTVTLTGAIPIPLTIHYTTQNGTQADHSALAGEDYQSALGTYTFSNINPTVTTQSFTISINILNDNIAELVQKFYVNLIIAGTFVYATASDLQGEGAISDTDKLNVLDTPAGSLYESGLPDGSAGDQAETPPISRSGNLLENQNFGQIPLSAIDINNINHVDQSGAAVYNNAAKTWTLTGDYFELIIYRDNIGGQLKGDYTYTLKNNVNNLNNNDFIQNLHFDVTPIDPGSQVNQNTRTDTGDVIIHIADDAPAAHDDTGVFYAIKGSEAGLSSGNLFANGSPDVTGADNPLTLVSFTYNSMTYVVPSEGSANVITLDGGTLQVYANGDFNYTPPEVNNEGTPGEPNFIYFNYEAQDTDGSSTNAAVDIRLYDQPKLSIDDVQIIEDNGTFAVFTVTLSGAIPTALTIHYSTQDGTALAGEDYTAILNGSHIFSDINPTHTTQSFTISVPIINDTIAELVESFSLNLDISGTYINATSDLSGSADISDPDALVVNNIEAGSVYEAGLSPDGSDAGNQVISQTGNLFTDQDFGEIPLSNIAITNISYPEQTGIVTDENSYTLTGPNFELVVYRADFDGHLKGDYIYTLTNPITNVDGNDFLQNLQFELSPIDPNSLITDQSIRADTGNININIVDDSPQAQDDTGVYYAIKGGDSSHASGNLFVNDINGSDKPLKILYLNYFDTNNEIQQIAVPDEGTITVQSYYGGMMTIDANGNFSYAPPAPDNTILPGLPNTDPFGYIVQDADGSFNNANFDVTLYDQPIIYVHPINVIEGTDSSANVVVELIGQIPSSLTVQYSALDNTAIAPDDYTSAELISITFTDTNVLSQQIIVSVTITDDSTPENTEDFILSVISGPVNFDSTNSQAHSQAIITIEDNEFYSLIATDDSPPSVPEIYIAPDITTPPAAQSGNLLTNDNMGTAPSDTIKISSIEFKVGDLLTNYPDLYQQYHDQGAVITPPESGSAYNVQFNVASDNTVLPIIMPDGSILNVQADGHYEFYQAPNGISVDTHYSWDYTITAPLAQPSNVGDDQATLQLAFIDQNIVVMTPPGDTVGDDTFNIDMSGAINSPPNLQVILDFGLGGNNTINFSNVIDSDNNSVFDSTDVAAQISSVYLDTHYPDPHVTFDLVNGTKVLMQNFGPLPTDSLNPTALLALIDEHGNITINAPPP